MAQLSESQLKEIQELELVISQDMFQRASNVCLKKCIPPNGNLTELSKNEAVCIDKCIAKYLEIQEVSSKKLASLQQEEMSKFETINQAAQAPK
ncbi:mitochondrial import inner membrane translocase subunit Tim10-like [Argopecten irradians]|uniref:mitochondrial import inner membrane translocase subunit Tim10-like n=1 Tax=Argopecten irradians TaxID=31199 RepID=UPI00370FE240